MAGPGPALTPAPAPGPTPVQIAEQRAAAQAAPAPVAAVAVAVPASPPIGTYHASALTAPQAHNAAIIHNVGVPVTNNVGVQVASATLSPAGQTANTPPPLSNHTSTTTSPREMINDVNRRMKTKGEKQIDQIQKEMKTWQVTGLKASKIFNAFLMALGCAVAFSALAAVILCPPLGLAAIIPSVIGVMMAPVIGGYIFGHGMGGLLTEGWQKEELHKNNAEIDKIRGGYRDVDQSLRLLDQYPNTGNGTSFEEFITKFSGGKLEVDHKQLKTLNAMFLGPQNQNVLKIQERINDLEEQRLEGDILQSTKAFLNTLPQPYPSLVAVRKQIEKLPNIKREKESLEKLQTQLGKIDNELINNPNDADLQAKKSNLDARIKRKTDKFNAMFNHLRLALKGKTLEKTGTPEQQKENADKIRDIGIQYYKEHGELEENIEAEKDQLKQAQDLLDKAIEKERAAFMPPVRPVATPAGAATPAAAAAPAVATPTPSAPIAPPAAAAPAATPIPAPGPASASAAATPAAAAPASPTPGPGPASAPAAAAPPAATPIPAPGPASAPAAATPAAAAPASPTPGPGPASAPAAATPAAAAPASPTPGPGPASAGTPGAAAAPGTPTASG